jgi:DNA polymerase (family 10)
MKQISNQEVALILGNISEYLEMQDIPFKPQAYSRAAQGVGDMEKSVREVYEEGGIKELKNIPGVGQSIAEHIEELIKTGKLAYYDQLKKQAPVDVAALTAVEGLGPKSIKRLYAELNVRSVADLARVAKQGKIRGLPGFGEKKEENILKGIEFLKKNGGRRNLGAVTPAARSIETWLKKVPGTRRLTIAGSMRRFVETIGDIDILAVADDTDRLAKAFVSMPNIARVLARGETKLSVKLASGLQVDLRMVPEGSYGAALNYFTGSKDHNVALREIAMKKGMKLNEYGLWKGKRQVAGKTEEEIYRALGMQYIEPELRENTGEISAAARKALPKIIGYDDLRGDLQVQTDWTDGSGSIEEMALAAAEQGLEYIVITDHTKRLAMAHGLDEERLLAQMAAIDRAQKKVGSKIKILKGTECDILKDGTLDLPDKVLAKLDVVGVSLHSFFNLPEEEQTERALHAIRNPHVDIFFHPTGRLIGKRQGCALDMERVIAVAKETGTVLEVNAFPDRLDLKDDHVRLAVEAGVKLAISSDSHAPAHFGFLPYGIAQARRGWAEKKDVVNAWPFQKMLKLLKKGV